MVSVNGACDALPVMRYAAASSPTSGAGTSITDMAMGRSSLSIVHVLPTQPRNNLAASPYWVSAASSPSSTCMRNGPPGDLLSWTTTFSWPGAFLARGDDGDDDAAASGHRNSAGPSSAGPEALPPAASFSGSTLHPGGRSAAVSARSCSSAAVGTGRVVVVVDAAVVTVVPAACWGASAPQAAA